MKRIISKVLVVVMLAINILSVGQVVRAEKEKGSVSRAIYVVFDNSGSMYGPGNMAWSQATYAMEVFAAMMNFENGDTMKVFPMHNVTVNGNGGTDSISSMTISSQDDIAQIHNMYTPNPKGTPYTQVNNAAQELTALLAGGGKDEGWLVVLTDGDFDSDIPASGLKSDLAQKAGSMENLFVQYLAIGSEVKNIPEGNGDVGFFAQKAGNSSEVVNELAVISNRIFKRNEYVDYMEGTELEFDVPLSKLIVFAQGKDVSVNSLKNAEGGEIKLQDSCKVSYSSTDGAGLTSYVTKTPTKDTSLKGEVAIFADSSSIMEGKYVLDVTGADSIKVYYEPDVKFGVGLFKDDTLVEGDSIEGGRYSIKIGFINLLSGEFVQGSKLLGEPDYKLKINGEEYELIGSGGASQSMELDVSGDSLELEADVTYLNDYIDHTDLKFQVCTLEMNVESPAKMKLKELESDSNQIVVSVMKNGAELTKEQWEAATVDIKSKDKEGNEFPLEWDVKPGSKVSTWILTPKYKNKDMFQTGTGEAEITVSVSTEIEGQAYGKAESVSLTIDDDKTILDYLQRYWKQVVISLIGLILFLGYIPPFKKRFSRKMKKRPSIEGTAEKVGIHDMMVKGKFEKDILSMILPYKAEIGRLTFSPAPVKKTAKLRSTGGSGMVILNTSAFAGKEEITFNGMSIQDNYKGSYRISASTIIVVATPEFTYTCIPNVQKTADGSIKREKGKKKGKK